jgi:hypothetical protein
VFGDLSISATVVAINSLSIEDKSTHRRSAMEQTQTASEAPLRLDEPFASKEVKWIVKATSRETAARAVSYPMPIGARTN